jgi:hypothetical protein
MNNRRHLKRYCVKEINEALLNLARSNVKRHSISANEMQEVGEVFGLATKSWDFDWKKRHKVEIYLTMNDTICSALRLPKGNLLEVYVALSPSYIRYWPRDTILVEVVEVNIHIDGLARTVRRASLSADAVKQLIRNHSLSELQQMRDDITGIQTGIFLNK